MSNKSSLCSWNICGLNDKRKRGVMAQILRTMRIDVLCIQETHITWNIRKWLNDLGMDILGFTKQSSSTRGVAILMRHGLGLCKLSREDIWGCWVIVEICVNNFVMMICSI